MKLHFTKMQGAGNDFVVLDCTKSPFSLTAVQLKRLADRRFGIGCDQFLIVESATQPGADFNYRIFNADGGEVENCGNGARAFVRFVRRKGLTDKSSISVDTSGGRLQLIELPDGGITVDMGIPRHVPAEIPFTGSPVEKTAYPLAVGAHIIDVSVVNMGNPHAVQVVNDVETAPVHNEGAAIETHPQFPQRVNAGFMQIVSPHAIKLRVWERGVGETLACGTGACAAVVAGIERKLLRSPVQVHARGGTLIIEWAGRGSSVRMTGPAEIVFEGVIEVE